MFEYLNPQNAYTVALFLLSGYVLVRGTMFEPRDGMSQSLLWTLPVLVCAAFTFGSTLAELFAVSLHLAQTLKGL